jgi:hypothetical protein
VRDKYDLETLWGDAPRVKPRRKATSIRGKAVD